MEDPKKKFAQYLKSSREKSGLTQKRVSDRLGYATPQFISNWERGVSTPPIEQLKILGKLYKKDATEIFELYLEMELQIAKAKLTRKFKAARR